MSGDSLGRAGQELCPDGRLGHLGARCSTDCARPQAPARTGCRPTDAARACPACARHARTGRSVTSTFRPFTCRFIGGSSRQRSAPKPSRSTLAHRAGKGEGRDRRRTARSQRPRAGRERRAGREHIVDDRDGRWQGERAGPEHPPNVRRRATCRAALRAPQAGAAPAGAAGSPHRRATSRASSSGRVVAARSVRQRSPGTQPTASHSGRGHMVAMAAAAGRAAHAAALEPQHEVAARALEREGRDGRVEPQPAAARTRGTRRPAAPWDGRSGHTPARRGRAAPAMQPGRAARPPSGTGRTAAGAGCRARPASARRIAPSCHRRPRARAGRVRKGARGP